MNMWLLGAGYWGSKLAQSLTKLKVSPRVVDTKHGQTIDDIDIQDPVIIATPLWQHYDQVMHLITRGHDVYVEKPAVETAVQAAEIQQMIQPDQLFMVGHLFVHHPQMALIKNLLSSGAIGELCHISSRRLNWGIYQTRTTPVLSLAAHDITIVQELTTPQLTVSRAHGWRLSAGDQYDRVQFSGHANDVSYDIDASWCWPNRTRETVLIGSRGQIIWDQDFNTVTLCHNQVTDKKAVIGNSLVYEYDSDMSPVEHELKHWLDCVQSRSQPRTGVEQAYNAAVVIDQVHKVLENGVLANPI